MKFCVEYFPRYVQGGRGYEWASIGCFLKRRDAVRRAARLVKSGQRKKVRIVEGR
jgi:hypothetical protein